MKKLNGSSEMKFARVALGFALASGLVATVGAAFAVSPVRGSVPATEIAPGDSVGINVLEPNRHPSTGGVERMTGDQDRQVQQWFPTGTGGGKGGSPKG